MLKKGIALFLVSIAYTILLGHDIIPHCHHDTDHHSSEHHHQLPQHGEEHEDDGLTGIFFHFIHSEDGFTFTISHNISSNFSKQQLSTVAMLPHNFSFDEFLE